MKISMAIKLSTASQLTHKLATVAILLAISTTAVAQQKHALLVGVGDHINPKNALKGPKNDLRVMRQLLIEKYNFRPENITTVQDSEATYAHIIADFEQRLIEAVRPGDLAFFYYSGHGTQTPDLNGDENDGYDECLVPYDAQDYKTLLLDDELAALIGRIPTENVTVIIDACHSGTATRGVLARPRYIPPDQLGIRGSTSKPAGMSQPQSKDNLSAELAGQTILTAARADQKALDYPFLWDEVGADSTANPFMGALTYYLVEEMRLDKDNQLTYLELAKKIRADLVKKGFDQEPQLEGRAQKRFLMLEGERTVSPQSDAATPPQQVASATIEVVQVRGSDVVVQAVAGTRLTPGSIFESMAVGEFTNGGTGRDSAGQRGAVRLAATNGQTALGQILDGRVAGGDRLAETFHFIPHPKLRVALYGDYDSLESLRQHLETLDFIEQVSEQDFRDVDLEIVTGAADSLQIIPYRNQQRLPNIASNSIESAIPEIRRVLDHLYAVKLLVDLQNPNPPFTVDVQVNGKDYEELAIGSEISFTVSVDRACYLYLVDVDPAGAVTLLFPNKYVRDNRLQAGRTYTMPAPELYKLQVSGPTGTEIVKAIATAQPLQLDIFKSGTGDFQSFGKSAANIARRIFDQLKREVNSNATRSITVLPARPADQPIATDGWSTDEVLVRVVE